MNEFVAWRELRRAWVVFVVVCLGASGRGPWQSHTMYSFVEIVSEFVFDEVANEYSMTVLVDRIHDSIGRHYKL